MHKETPKENTPKPATLKAALWFTFSGTAMLSAFTLPIHFWLLAHGKVMDLSWWLPRLYFFVLFGAALYHGLYRTKTIAFDLGLIKIQKSLGIILSLLFFASMLIFAVRLFS